MKPRREHATHNSQTYFVTSNTWGRRALFRAEPWARLFFKSLLSYRGKAYLLHEFVLMPDHFHLLITPLTSLERAVQFIKGGFSHRAKTEFGSNMEVWQRGFDDHRIRDAEDCDLHVHYIWNNPVKRRLCDRAEDYPYCSAFAGWKLDPIPQRLKPVFSPARGGTAEAVPCQSDQQDSGTRKAVPSQSEQDNGTPKAVPCQSERQGNGTPEAVPCHDENGTSRNAEVNGELAVPLGKE